jgi:hypothetical protein
MYPFTSLIETAAHLRAGALSARKATTAALARIKRLSRAGTPTTRT